MNAIDEPLADFPGDFHRHEDGWTVRLRREIPHPPKHVWRYLTDREYLPLWLAPGEVEPRRGGRARIAFEVSGSPIDALVTELEPERVLAYCWSEREPGRRPLRWQLEPRPVGTGLSLHLHLHGDDPAAKFAAGWDTHLEMLLAALEGVPISFPLSRFKAAREAFREITGAD